MKKTLVFLTAILLLSGCSVTRNKEISGHYRSTCYNLGFPDLEAHFNKDGTFSYKHAHNPDIIFGKWKIENDTLFLFSEKFEIETTSIEEVADYIIAHPDSTDVPSVSNGQYTQMKGKDVYLIKDNKLYPMTENGHTKYCHLIRVKK